MAGFAVVDAVPGRRLRLAGRHHFARYALVTRPEGTLLAARTHAALPGLRGRAYRRLVSGSGFHRLLVTRQLRMVRRRAMRHEVRQARGRSRPA